MQEEIKNRLIKDLKETFGNTKVVRDTIKDIENKDLREKIISINNLVAFLSKNSNKTEDKILTDLRKKGIEKYTLEV